jgi:hypothetical protein
MALRGCINPESASKGVVGLIDFHRVEKVPSAEEVDEWVPYGLSITTSTPQVEIAG